MLIVMEWEARFSMLGSSLPIVEQFIAWLWEVDCLKKRLSSPLLIIYRSVKFR